VDYDCAVRADSPALPHRRESACALGRVLLRRAMRMLAMQRRVCDGSSAPTKATPPSQCCMISCTSTVARRSKVGMMLLMRWRKRRREDCDGESEKEAARERGSKQRRQLSLPRRTPHSCTRLRVRFGGIALPSAHSEGLRKQRKADARLRFQRSLVEGAVVPLPVAPRLIFVLRSVVPLPISLSVPSAALQLPSCTHRRRNAPPNDFCFAILFGEECRKAVTGIRSAAIQITHRVEQMHASSVGTSLRWCALPRRAVATRAHCQWG
jgi:hypothetical protein